jgi:hypothetical protein
MIKSLILSAVLSALTVMQVPQGAPVGTIQGTVLRQGTNDPVADVQISIAFATAGRGAASSLTALSDNAGRFVINNVPVGNAVVRAQLQGYFGAPVDGASPTLATAAATVTAGQTTEIRVLMIPGGTISGKVIDASGKPLIETRVQALRLAYQNGALAPQTAGERTTDDRGEYRIFRLAPGEYFIVATPQRPSVSGPANPATPPRDIPVRTFYPSIEDMTTAIPVVVRGGDDMAGMDIRVRSVPAARISGKVISTLSGPAVRPFATAVGPAGEVRPSIADVSLVRQNRSASDDVVGGSIRAAADGTFEIQNVLPGSYELIARLPITIGWGDANPPPLAAAASAFGRTTLTVRAPSTDNVTVTIRPGMDLRGTVVVDGKPTPAAVRISLQADDLAGAGVMSAVLSQVAAFEPAISPDGSFLIPMVPEAHYRFVVTPRAPQIITQGATQQTASVRAPQADLVPLPANAYVADIRQAGVSVYDNGLAGASAGQATIEVLINTNPGSLEGTVTRDQRPAANATVVLVPETNRRQNPALYKVARSDAQGRFTFTLIPPGLYKVFAWDSIQASAYQNAGFLEKVETRGVGVSITPGSRSSTSVGLITNEGSSR